MGSSNSSRHSRPYCGRDKLPGAGFSLEEQRYRSEILTILNEVEELVASFTSFGLVLEPFLQLNNDLAWKTFYGKRFFKKLYK